LETVEKLDIQYMIIDTSSIHNDDQFYLIMRWYSKRIPPQFERMRGENQMVLKYKIVEG